MGRPSYMRRKEKVWPRKCLPGQHWVKGHRTKNSSIIRTARIERTRKYGWDRGPVYTIEEKTVGKLGDDHE